MTRRLLVMRHGVTAHNRDRVVQGHLDTPLSDEGRSQARQAAGFVAGFSPEFILSSDLSRAAETAEQVAAVLGVRVELDPRLRESHSGMWQGKRVTELEPRPDWATFGVSDKRGGPTGESVLDVVERVRPLLAEVDARLSAGGVGLLVTHGVTARALVAEQVGLDQAVAWRMLGGLQNCALAELEDSDRGWRVRSWNVLPSQAADLGLNPEYG
ncbi:histidine phosphatase family protein [Dermatophilus congolensis]|uniref:Phosphoglyceromutase n=1 Tax=Dermatophilus congolensis TaxID=1863 RepID=A0A239VH02_9MICO|nr:histidine phosphatase family protein [Dermatophilus congolensis]SNV21176.1 Phosphoglyceromutase [Dermatophilus congolensis]